MTRLLLLLTLVIAGIASAAARAQDASPAATPEPACGPPAGLLLAQAVTTPERQTAVALIDPATGAETGRIDLPPVEAAWPAPLPGKALAVAGGALYLIDATAMRAKRIELPDGDAGGLAPNPVQFRGSAGERYMLLGSPSFDRALLIDLEMATAASLPALLGATPESPIFVSFAAVTPGDRHVVLWDGRHVYLVETAQPSAARRIDTDEFAFAPASSPDGAEIVFSQSSAPGSGSTVVRFDTATGEPAELLAGDRALVTLWVPGSRTLLVDARTERGAAAGDVSLLDVDTGEARNLLSYSGSLTTVQFNPAGTRALLGVERIDGGEWHIADLTSGTVTQLTGLTGISVQPGLFANARWALAVPQLQPGDAFSGPAYRAIDLETGRVARLMAQRPGSVYPEPPTLSPDGRFALVREQRGETTVLWLLDAVAVRATELTGSGVDAALYSPNGCYLALEGSAALQVLSVRGDAPLVDLRSSTGRLLAWLTTESDRQEALLDGQPRPGLKSGLTDGCPPDWVGGMDRLASVRRTSARQPRRQSPARGPTWPLAGRS